MTEEEKKYTLSKSELDALIKNAVESTKAQVPPVTQAPELPGYNVALEDSKITIAQLLGIPDARVKELNLEE